MELKQQLKLSQQLIMTPQLQQAIKLLQMSRMELSELVQEELLENPVLEEGAEQRESSVNVVEEAATPEMEAHQAKKDEIDWERYLENQSNEAPMPAVRRGPDEEMPGLEATLSSSEDLSDHLGWQLRMGDFVDDERRFGALVIGNLDDNGYLRIEGIAPEDIVPRLSTESGLDAEERRRALPRPHPGARGAAECDGSRNAQRPELRWQGVRAGRRVRLDAGQVCDAGRRRAAGAADSHRHNRQRARRRVDREPRPPPQVRRPPDRPTA